MHANSGTRTAVIILAVLAFAAAALPACAEEGWQWGITPYIWASAISEDLTVRGTSIGGNDTSFSDLVDLVDTSFQIHFEGVRGRWGMYADLTYIKLSDEETGEILHTDAEIEELLFEAGALYRPGGSDGPFSLLFGLRLLAADETYLLTLGDLGPFELANDEEYLDAMIGLRYRWTFGDRWLASLHGDVSFGDTDLFWTAQALGGWRWGARRQHAILFGYRYRQLEYEKAGVFEVDKTLSGPIVGALFGF